MTSVEPIYHLGEVAGRCGVSTETVYEWLDAGLRHVPLGHSEVYRPRDIIVRESWLSDFLDAQSVVKPRGKGQPQPEPTPPPPAEKPRARASKPKPPARRKAGNVLGPCPV